jgi:hypothetical protein
MSNYATKNNARSVSFRNMGSCVKDDLCNKERQVFRQLVLYVKLRDEKQCEKCEFNAAKRDKSFVSSYFL